MNGLLRFGTMALLCVTLTGCLLRHKPKAVVPTAAQTPVPIENTPEPQTEPVIAQVPETPVPLPAVKVPVQKVKKVKKKVVVPDTTPAPVQVASAVPPPPPVAEAVIGALTVGGDDAPEKKRQASGMIMDLDKRLAGLGADTLDKQKEGIARVRYFEKEARTALNSGDVEGAVTLVTKAKVLLDDLTK
jgi:hypothetical protein